MAITGKWRGCHSKTLELFLAGLRPVLSFDNLHMFDKGLLIFYLIKKKPISTCFMGQAAIGTFEVSAAVVQVRIYLGK